jgi:hypothetical protein
MAQHSVEIDKFPQVEILHNDIVITIRSNKGRLGQLTISKGGIGWFPKWAQQERHFSWEAFDRLVKEAQG